MGRSFVFPLFFGGVEHREGKIIFYDFEEMEKVSPEISAVESVSWCITKKCNYNCFYCLNDTHEDKERLNFGKVVKRIKELNPKKITITGGEPTLEPRLPEFVKKFIRMGKEVRIISNGSRVGVLSSLPEEVKLTISIDSLSERYFKMLTSHFTPEQIVRNILYLKEMGYEVDINIVYNKFNEDEIEPMVKFFVKRGISRFFISYVFPRGYALRCYEKIRGSMKKYAKLLKKLSGMVEINQPVHPDFTFLYPRCGSCEYRYLPRVLFLSRSGKVLYCDQFYGKDSDMRYLRDINPMLFKKECKKCVVRWICNGGCRANAYYLSGSEYERDTISCEIFREWMRINKGIRERMKEFDYPAVLNYNFEFFLSVLRKNFEGSPQNLEALLNVLSREEVDELFYFLWAELLFRRNISLFDILSSNVKYFLKKGDTKNACRQIAFFWLGEQFLYSGIGK